MKSNKVAMNSTFPNPQLKFRIRTTAILFFAILLSANLSGCLNEYDNTPKNDEDTSLPDTGNRLDTDILDSEDAANDADTSEIIDKTCVDGCADTQYCFEGICYTPPMLALGSEHSCTLYKETIHCWGSNTSGQVGTDDADDFEVHPTPQHVEIDGTPTKIAASVLQTCAISGDKKDRTKQEVYCWGAHSALEYVTGGNYKYDEKPQKIDDLRQGMINGIVPEQLAMGSNHICARFDSTFGRVRCWGNNYNGQLGNKSNTSSIKPVTPLDLLPSQQLTAGDGFTCTLNNNHTVSCWGVNRNGQLGQTLKAGIEANTQQLVPNLKDVISIEAGQSHACALLAGNTMECWGENRHGQLGIGTSKDSFEPVAPTPPLEGVQQVALGKGFTCALLMNGEVHCAGANYSGELGRPAAINDKSETFIKNPYLTNVHRISAGSNHLCAVHNDNQLSCWGYNESNQVGESNVNRLHEPFKISLKPTL